MDVVTDNLYVGRSSVPSGASIGNNEVNNFPNRKPEKCVQMLNNNSKLFIGLDSSDLKCIHETIRSIDKTKNYSNIGGAFAFAVTIAATESASKSLNIPMFMLLTKKSKLKFPYPLGNILGGGVHAGPGTPDIQEILICAHGSKSIIEAIETNFRIHRELRNVLENKYPNFTNGRNDEGGWAPEIDNEKALEMSSIACENLGYAIGKEVSLGIDFASSTQWDQKKKKYVYKRGRFETDTGEQIELVSKLIKKYKLIYVEDPTHQESFNIMAELTKKFPRTLIVGDDLTVTNKNILKKAIKSNSCNATILKVNQAGSLYDALEFADLANKHDIKIITSHRSGESIDSHIIHIGISTNSIMLKVGITGGERVAKLNELVRISEHNLIHGMVQI